MLHARIVAMPFPRSISMLLLIALLAWSAGAVCAPAPSMHGMQCMMGGGEPAAASHACCPPERTTAMSCHGKRNDRVTRCAVVTDDEAVLTSTKYRDDGMAQANASATPYVMQGAPASSHRPRQDRPLPHTRAVLDIKSDLRI
jgi:hypothetical protein